VFGFDDFRPGQTAVWRRVMTGQTRLLYLAPERFDDGADAGSARTRADIHLNAVDEGGGIFPPQFRRRRTGKTHCCSNAKGFPAGCVCDLPGQGLVAEKEGPSRCIFKQCPAGSVKRVG
jgi:hypothetical protein